MPKSVSSNKRTLLEWSHQDDAEYNRLSAEMNEDAKLQFTFFTFGITASTAVLGFLTSSAVDMASMPLLGLPTGVLFLVPLVILLPTSLLILNRTRTRNRKAAYIIIHLDYKRLRADGITDSTPLKKIREHPFLPWETALHIIERTNKRAKQNAHFPPALKYMYICYSAIEFVCVFLAFFISWNPRSVGFWAMVIFVVLVSLPVYWIRIQTIRLLKNELSIQGYVKRWLEYKFERYQDAPLYIREWIDEFTQKYSVINPL